MGYKITGTVLKIGPKTDIATRYGAQFYKRDLVIRVIRFDPVTGVPEEDSENTPKFTFTGPRCNDLDALKEGQTVTVDFSIYGRSYEKDGEERWFTEVRPWNVTPGFAKELGIVASARAKTIESAAMDEPVGTSGVEIPESNPFHATLNGGGNDKKDEKTPESGDGLPF